MLIAGGLVRAAGRSRKKEGDEEMGEQLKSQACPELETVLDDYTSDVLSAAEKEGVAAHLQSCAGCSAAVEATVQARALLRAGAEATEDPGPFFARRVMTRIKGLEERASSEKGFWRPLEIWAMRTVWASAAAIALLVAYVNISGVPQRQTAVEVRTGEQGGLFVDPSTAPPMSRDDAFLSITDTRNGQ